jgi:hypothetical protein
MRISFRQGLVRAPLNFLQLAAGKVNLVIPPTDSMLLTFADGAADYLITERVSITNAWTGPFIAGAQSYWLYLDLNVLTGQRTFNHTLLMPVEGATAPVAPANDQHWFDTTVNKMKVWNSVSGTWIPKIRVFAATLTGGTILGSVSINAPLYTGTQVGSLQSIAVEAGALVFDGDSIIVKHSNGTFLTTEDVVLTGIASSSHVKFGSIVIEAAAGSAIAAYSIVRFTAFNTVTTATNYLLDNSAYGIVDRSGVSGDILSITMEGLITNPAWDWTSAGINAQLYVDGTGQLTTAIPPTPIPVAAVVDKSTILLRPSSLFLNTSNDPSTIANLGTVVMSVAPSNPVLPVAVGTNDVRITSILPHIADTTQHLTIAQNTYLDSIDLITGMVVRRTDGTAVGRTLTAPAAGLTITNPTGDAGNPTFALANIGAIEAISSTGIAIRTAADTWTTRAVIAPAAGLSIVNGDGVAGNPTLSLANDLAAVEGLTTTGFAVRTAADTWTTRTITGTAGRVAVANGAGSTLDPVIDLSSGVITTPGTYRSITVDTYGRATAGTNPTTLSGYGITDAQPLSTSLTNFAAYVTTGILAQTAAGTYVARILQAPAAGLTITNPYGVVGDPTFALANDIGAIEGLTTTGFAVRTATDTWTTRTITGTATRITVTNGTGATLDPVIDLTSGVITTPGTYKSVTIDTYGRTTAGTNPTTLAGFGITDAQPLSTSLTNFAADITVGIIAQTASGTYASRTLTGTATRITVTNGTGVTADPVIDLTSGVITTPGTYKSVTIDTYGRATAGTNPTTLAGFGITDAQPLSTSLTNFAADVTTGIIAQTAAGTYASRTLTGTASRISVTNGTGVAADPVVDIASSYVGQTTLTTLGTISTGTWQATAVAPTYGGTGTTALGAANTVLGVNAGGTAGEYKTLTGTANQVIITPTTGVLTFTLPQSINTGATVTFGSVTAFSHRTTITVLTSAASITWDMSLGSNATVVLATNATLANPTNLPTSGTIVVLKVQQDATGARTLAYGTSYKFTGAAAPVVAAGANQVSMLQFWCDGTALYELSRSLNVA